ncbi:MAG TPA: hypothetical protein VIK04_04665 [Solirubrobacteraceae bacterium]
MSRAYGDRLGLVRLRSLAGYAGAACAVEPELWQAIASEIKGERRSPPARGDFKTMTAGSSPSTTDWIGSIGTAAAFMVAAVSFGYDRFRRRRTDRLAQARLVDGWLADPKLGETDIQGAARSTLTFCGYISNASREVS